MFFDSCLVNRLFSLRKDFSRLLIRELGQFLEYTGAIFSPPRLRGNERRGFGFHCLRLLDDQCKIREDGCLKRFRSDTA